MTYESNTICFFHLLEPNSVKIRVWPLSWDGTALAGDFLRIVAVCSCIYPVRAEGGASSFMCDGSNLFGRWKRNRSIFSGKM